MPSSLAEHLRASLQLSNTLGRSVQRFEPLEDNRVRMYVCGPTVYAEPHVGNMRMYISADEIRRVLRLAGYEVLSAINVTDVGHLTSDADEGEDKMAKAASRERLTAWDVAEKYTKVFFDYLEELNVLPFDHVLPATRYIDQQIALIERLEQKGVVYRTDDGMYFDTSKVPDYGKLTPHDDRSNLLAGGRVELGLEGKRHFTDFALWKFSPADGPRRDMEWSSPWGVGFPGWHIECSAMAMHVLGETLDIHVGGIDHIPIHHTNEIAQSETATGRPFARWWMHGAFLMDANHDRIAKSTGNLVTLDGLRREGYSPLEFRYFMLQSHYRHPVSFSMHALDAASRAHRRLRQHVAALRDQTAPDPEAADGDDLRQFAEALADDVNTPRAIAVMWGVLRDSDTAPEAKLALVEVFESALGLGLLQTRAEDSVTARVLELAERRWQLRKERRFEESDKLRDELAAEGFTVLDGRDDYQLIPLTP